jgi:hypothetical protein
MLRQPSPDLPSRLTPLRRQAQQFLRRPPTVRRAAGLIVTTTMLVVVVGGLLLRLTDPHEFPTLEASFWWSLQTATTVGYGDVTPTTLGGRLVGALVMLNGVALIVVVTSTITSTFVARAQRERPGLRRDHDPSSRVWISWSSSCVTRPALLRSSSPPMNDAPSSRSEFHRTGHVEKERARATDRRQWTDVRRRRSGRRRDDDSLRLLDAHARAAPPAAALPRVRTEPARLHLLVVHPRLTTLRRSPASDDAPRSSMDFAWLVSTN